MSDEKEAPPAPKAKPVRYGFSCGGAGVPCRTFRVFESEPETPKLPTQAEEDLKTDAGRAGAMTCRLRTAGIPLGGDG
jgi:hypothetical protein